jgi:enediyne biosynthesis protein E4
LYFTGGRNQDALFKNNGNGTFTDVSASAGLCFTDSTISMCVTTGDVDNDGFRDVFVGTMGGEANYFNWALTIIFKLISL